jgi:hypothetical protein
MPSGFCGPRASSIKKNLAGLLGSCVPKVRVDVPNAHTYVSKVANARVIMGLQDMRAGNTFSACKTSGQYDYNAAPIPGHLGQAKWAGLKHDKIGSARAQPDTKDSGLC